MVLEWVEGDNLRPRRCVVEDGVEKERVRISLSPCTLLEDVSRGMQYLHPQSPITLHRNLKPANLLVEIRGPRAKIADWALCAGEGCRSGWPRWRCRVHGTSVGSFDLSQQFEVKASIPHVSQLCLRERPAEWSDFGAALGILSSVADGGGSLATDVEVSAEV